MTRSAKDLRELINISRLSFHGDEKPEVFVGEPCQNGCQKTDVNKSRKEESVVEERSNSTSIDSRFKPLPAIMKSSTTAPSIFQNAERCCEKVLSNMDVDIVNTWLVRAIKAVNSLSHWVSKEYNFVRLSHFLFHEMKTAKQRELIELEMDIIVNEMSFAVWESLQNRSVTDQDVRIFLRIILWEYPDILCGNNCSYYLLNTLLVLCSGQKELYRKLLSNVRSWTKKPENIHLTLSSRVFAIISVVLAVVKFYLTINNSQKLPEVDGKPEKCHQDVMCQLVFDSVKCGYIDVLQYFISEHNHMDIMSLRNQQQMSIFFTAVLCGHLNIVKLLLQYNPNLTEVSLSGNGLLHAAVNSENVDILKVLLNVGCDVNQTNSNCDNITALHLAVMQGNILMVSTLLNNGADFSNNNLTDISSPFKLAHDMGMVDIIKLMDDKTLDCQCNSGHLHKPEER